MHPDDASLVAKVLSGETEAFAILVQRHFAEAFTVAKMLTATIEDAEDACQDAFARAYFRMAECRTPGHFRAWLMQIVRRRAHNLRDYQLLRAAVALEDAAPMAARDSPVDDLLRAGLRHRLRAVLRRLSPIKQAVVQRHDVDGWTHTQVAAALGISVLMSRRHLSDARRQLREALADLEFEGRDDD